MSHYFTFALAACTVSWIVGMLLNSLLIKTVHYKKLSHFNFIPGKKANKFMGMPAFKWIVKNTFFKFFNQKIKLENKKTDLAEIHHEMTVAEMGHLIGFLFVTAVALYKGFTEGILFGLVIMALNLLMNLYPSLLQQENKRRLDKLIQRQNQ
ncbi:hypothetical protein LAG90_02210 [Marinilongibacter aquaticus]|uniref:glycosyl-4,4'-diaponeurosporenoate acyltransferase CrtO family protein n=1 Tax=Marinilongibacter aquaticus TaxID=2975157 RepID=UPI0021BD3900|nr:hypothetical protein [Marinilongibacter aquaticus]UBM59470.1 hypothetical protein LAG90_02210 [Marinilongibacter aquaticus]